MGTEFRVECERARAAPRKAHKSIKAIRGFVLQIYDQVSKNAYDSSKWENIRSFQNWRSTN